MKKINNIILLVILVALISIYAFTQFFRGERESNIPQFIANPDTASISQIKVYAQANDYEEISLIRSGSEWTVKTGEKSIDRADFSLLTSTLNLFPLKPIDLITRKQEKWKDYQVGDSSTHVIVFQQDKKIIDLRLGKIGFSAASGQQYGSGNAHTYIRRDNESEVYSVEGFLNSAFDKSFNEWRDKTFTQVSKAEISKILFTYPADSGFVLEKTESKWIVDKEIADSTQVVNYLSHWEDSYASTFSDNYTPTEQPELIIQVFNGITTLVTVKGWRQADDWILNSSHRANAYFTSNNLQSLLAGKEVFLKKP